MNRRSVIAAAIFSTVMLRLAFAQQGPGNQEPTNMKIRMTFGEEALTATLYDNPSARDFYTILPLRLTIEDFAHNEKIAHLPRKLTEEGSGPFDNERPGDLCYYTPWGNLAMFYADYRHPGLIRLGRFDDFTPLLRRGKFPLLVEAI